MTIDRGGVTRERLARRFTLRLPAVLMLLFAVAGCGDDGGNSTSTPPVPIATYALSGTVAHLDTGSVTISDGSETVTVPQGSKSLAFSKPLASGTAYAVTVTAQPAGENCIVANGSGTITGAAVTNVALTCNTVVTKPVAIGVSASGSLRANTSRIFLPISQVGSVSTTINAVLDTGSNGSLLQASDVFPASMVDANGFVFPAGQTSMTYNGITVTNVVGSRTYGAQSSLVTVQTGNLGFAQVTFGSGTSVTTATMPVLFVFKTTSNGAPVATTNFANLIGVNPGITGFTVDGVAPGTTRTPCSMQATTSCGLASPFRYLNYANGVDEGFVLGNVTFSPCDITTPGACPVTPSLTVGVGSNILSAFSTTALSSCGPITFIAAIGEPVCSQVIPSVTVASGGYALTGPAIFDSGAPTTRLSVPAGMMFPSTLPDGAAVQITTASGFSYQYTTGTGYYTTTVSQNAGAADYSNTGIGFFAQNSLLVDYAQALEGWRSGS